MTEGQKCFSNPEQPIRHSYPLAINEEGFQAACRLCLRTSPLILARAAALSAFGLAALVWLALCGGIASLFGGSGGLILFLIAVGIPGGIFFWLNHYVMYLLKAAHVAVITKLITEGALPDGSGQVQYGKELVTARFAQTNVMFAIDAMVKGIVRSFNSRLDSIADMLPIPGMESFMQALSVIIKRATTYIDETIFSYNLARNDDNVWRSSMDGLVYYGQNVKAVLKTAIVSVILEYSLTFAAFVAGLVPALIISKILPGSVASFAWLFAVVFAYIVRETVLHPLFLTMVALTFHKHAHNQPINEQVAGALSTASSKFDELCEKSRLWVQENALKLGSEAVQENPAPALAANSGS